MGASNYNMQCLNSPNREEVDAAHTKGEWLDIGVLSLRNYMYMGRRKVWLWLLLAFSSLPLHLLFNSAVFATLQTNDYLVVVVTQDFRQDYGIDCHLPTGLEYPDVICKIYATAQDSVAAAANLTRLNPSDCVDHYSNYLQTQLSNMIAVSNNTLIVSDELNSTTLLSAYTNYAVTDTWNPMRWTCSDDHKGTCNLEAARQNTTAVIQEPSPRKWIIHGGYLIDHCLTSSVTETCKLKMSLPIIITVVICNASKLIAIIVTLLTLKGDILITLGDAIASFLTNPDSTTKGGCLAMKIDLERSFFRPRRYFQGNHTGKNEPYQFLQLFCFRVETAWKSVPDFEVSLRWYQAPSNKRWLICVIL